MASFGISISVWALTVLTVDHWNGARHILTLSICLVAHSPLYLPFSAPPFVRTNYEQRVARYIEEQRPGLEDRP
jgi:hypothetical protein